MPNFLEGSNLKMKITYDKLGVLLKQSNTKEQRGLHNFAPPPLKNIANFKHTWKRYESNE